MDPINHEDIGRKRKDADAAQKDLDAMRAEFEEMAKRYDMHAFTFIPAILCEDESIISAGVIWGCSYHLTMMIARTVAHQLAADELEMFVRILMVESSARALGEIAKHAAEKAKENPEMSAEEKKLASMPAKGGKWKN